MLEKINDIRIRKMKMKWLLTDNDEVVLQQIPEFIQDDLLMREEKRNTYHYSPRFQQILSNARLRILQKRIELKKSSQ